MKPNGENNRDGAADNFSENCGVEGETADAGIEALRKSQIKNFLLTLLISRGVPMLLGGDEFRRTQRGNNNAWCQDNDTSWFDWTCLERHRETHRFIRGMIAFRRAHPVLSEERFYTDSRNPVAGPGRRIAELVRPERKSFRLRDPGKRTGFASPDVQCRARILPILPSRHCRRDSTGIWRSIRQVPRRRTCSPRERNRLWIIRNPGA